MLLAVVALWGITFVLVKDALKDTAPLLFNFLRMSVAALALIFLNRRHLRHIPRRTIASGAIVGLFLAAGYQFQTAGLARTTASKSAFITSLVVVIVPLLTAIPAVRPASAPAPGIATLLGAFLAFAGLMFLTTPTGTTWSNLVTSVGTGDLLTLLCAIAFAGHLIALAHTSPQVPIPQLATLQILFAALLMGATLSLGGPIYFSMTPRLIVALAVTGLLATAAAFTIQSWAQRHLSPSHTALLLTLEPVFAWLTSFFFLGEQFGSRSFVGALLILLGILVTELLPLSSPVSKHPF
jgi:drug/metabolite transporter (DMT)-like permease